MTFPAAAGLALAGPEPRIGTVGVVVAPYRQAESTIRGPELVDARGDLNDVPVGVPRLAAVPELPPGSLAGVSGRLQAHAGRINGLELVEASIDFVIDLYQSHDTQEILRFTAIIER